MLAALWTNGRVGLVTQLDSQSVSGVHGLIAGTHTLLVGIEDQDDGGLRLYLNSRSLGLYALTYDPEAQEEIRQAWGRKTHHITLPVPPPDAIYEEAAA